MKYLTGKKIAPRPITKNTTIVELVEDTFFAYNSARLQEGCRLFAEKMLEDDVTVACSITGALTPAGLAQSCLIPLIEHGFIDWMTSTGANLYHDTHFGIGLDLHCGSPAVSDIELRQKGVVRIYDILFHYQVLLQTDAFYRQLITAPEFQRTMSTAEFHYRVGRYVKAREKALGLGRCSLLSAAHDLQVPIYTPSPGDSSIGPR